MLAMARIHSMGQGMDSEAIEHMHKLAEYVAELEAVVADIAEVET